MAKPQLVLREDGYLIRVDGKESEEVDYGTPTELVVGGKTYIAYVTVDDDGEPETSLGGLMYVGSVVEPETVDEAPEEDDSDSDSGDEDADGDQDEEEISVEEKEK